MNLTSAYTIFPVSESAMTVDFGNFIDKSLNQKILTLFEYLQSDPPEGMVEVIPAYSSLTIYYDVMVLRKKDPSQLAFTQMKKKIEAILQKDIAQTKPTGRHIRIPVYYDGNDLNFISTTKNISQEEIIRLHSEPVYYVYMLGFLPGFAYLGQVNETIRMPRKPHPMPVSAGSIGIAGTQTGIYPLPSPGGWQIIGHTPLTLFHENNKEGPTLLKAGDTVQFYSISSDEFANY